MSNSNHNTSSSGLNIDLLGMGSPIVDDNSKRNIQFNEEVDFNDIKPNISKEEHEKYVNYLFDFMDVYGKCSSAAIMTGLKAEEERILYTDLCSTNELKKRSTNNGLGIHCLDDLNLIEGKPFSSLKEKSDRLEDLNYCLQEDEETVFNLRKLESIRLGWREPYSLKNFLPRLAQILTSKQLQKKNGDFVKLKEDDASSISNQSDNLIETYRYDKEVDNDASVIDKFSKLSNTFAKKEFQDLSDCVAKQPKMFANSTEHLATLCLSPLLKYLYLMEAISCKDHMVRCLAKKNELYNAKLEDSALFDYIECANESPCIPALDLFLDKKHADMVAMGNTKK
ncbi:hypothetical protein ABK040_007066 [Willaertia magna]